MLCIRACARYFNMYGFRALCSRSLVLYLCVCLGVRALGFCFVFGLGILCMRFFARLLLCFCMCVMFLFSPCCYSVSTCFAYFSAFVCYRLCDLNSVLCFHVCYSSRMDGG